MTESNECTDLEASGSEYTPSHAENSDSEQAKRKSNKKNIKKSQNVKKWKRNVAKLKSAHSEAYMGHRGKKKPGGRQMATNCKCKKNCLSSLIDEHQQSFLKAFNDMADQERQDAYLSGLITALPVARRRVVKDGPREIELCKMGFCLLYGIGKRRVERIVTHMSTSVIPPTDGQGKHENRANAIPKNMKTAS
ncbi:hypothetical protein PR048_021549 [Dryococelus australis]|uniref:Uncharacterized protein n=1 Tax=Dryococelus australis TaxID=614101 RepID=A0ABQ9GYH5_9NEOP|nr:hypothetical protein PR048_021549 [Dryococelus australis]